MKIFNRVKRRFEIKTDVLLSLERDFAKRGLDRTISFSQAAYKNFCNHKGYIRKNANI